MNRTEKIMGDFKRKMLAIGFVGEDTEVFINPYAEEKWIHLLYEDRVENTKLLLEVPPEFRGYRVTLEKVEDSRKKDLTKLA